MKIIIDGKEYKAVNQNGASLLHLLELQVQTRELYPPNGIGTRRMAELERAVRQHERERALALSVGDEPLPPDDAMLFMAITVFLTRRSVGERLSFTDAIDCNPEFALESEDKAESVNPPVEGSDSPETPGAPSQ